MGHKEGAAKAAAKRIGVSVEEYLAHKNNRGHFLTSKSGVN